MLSFLSSCFFHLLPLLSSPPLTPPSNNPTAGSYLHSPPLDPLGGLLLSLYIILTWTATALTHIHNLTGAAASNDERAILLYLTTRFAPGSIRQVQGLGAYHAGDRLNVEVDVVLDEGMQLRDSHDLGEALGYVLEAVPGVERAWVHVDYWAGNRPSHLEQ